MDADTKSLIFNVIGGIVVAVLTAIYIGILHRLRSYNFQRLFQFRFKPDEDIKMVYGQLSLIPLKNQSGQQITHPYIKPIAKGRTPLNQSYSIEHPISECEVRASNYIAGLLGIVRNLRALLVSDIEVNSLLDSNFITFGGPGSNYKTADVLASEANIFIRMASNSFSLPSGENLPFTCTREVDHGFILRIKPPEFPERSWIVCAGLGEWGTSGSAWFLAYKWNELIKKIHTLAYYSCIMQIPDFMAIIRVSRVQGDQSARMVALYRNDNGQIKNIIHA